MAEVTRVSSGDMVALGAAGGVAIVAYASLQLADLHHEHLPSTLLLSAMLAALFGLLVWRFGRPAAGVLRDRLTLLTMAVCGLACAGLTFPGFADGAANEDPGVYVAEGVQIARSGSYSFIDPLLSTPGLPVQLVSPGARFGGIWVRDPHAGLIVPQFFHLQPALLASGYDLGGFRGLELVTPLCAVVGVLLAVALLRRLGGHVAALAGGLLLAVNELQTWQARSPSSEALAQLCWLGALYGLVVAAQTGWRPAAGLAGVLVGMGFLDRADGVIAVLLLALLGAVLVAVGRWDLRAWWGLAGLALTLPLGLWQAYAGAVVYTRVNKVPSLTELTLAVAGLFGVALLVRVVCGPVTAGTLAPRTRRLVGIGIPALVLLLLLLGLARPHLQATQLHSTGKGTVAPTQNELNVRRFSWLIGYPVLAAAILGVAVVTLRRWSAAAWIFLLATLAEAALYLYDARNSPQLMFWARRYVPAVLPGFITLAALAIAWAWRRRLGQVIGALLVLGTAVWSLVGAVGVRTENDYGGSIQAASRIASAARGGVLLWELDGSSTRSADRMLASPTWLEQGVVSVGMPRKTSPARAKYVSAYRERFGPGRIYVVTAGTARPGELEDFSLTPVLHETGPIRAREEAILRVPTAVRVVPIDVTVWRVN